MRTLAQLILLVAVGSATVGLAAEPPATQTVAPDHPTLFRELKSGRSQLLRGAFHGTGHQIFSPDPKRMPAGTPATLRGDFSFACQFDYPKNTVAWERENPFIEIWPDQAKAGVSIESCIFLRDERGEFFEEFQGPLKLQRDQPPRMLTDKSRMAPMTRPWDVRTFGLGGESSLVRGTTFEETSKMLDKAKVTDVQNAPDGQLIVVIDPVPGTQYKFWIHPGRGYTADRCEVHADGPKDGGKLKQMAVTTCQWEQKNSVSVPVSMKGETHWNGPESWEIELKWDRVNE